MNSRIPLCVRLFSAVLALLCFARAQAAPPASPARPNVLFIAVDDLNHWVGYLGRNPQTRTPNIDKLAARGLSFTRSYCAAPVCNPSRAALMSGLRPSTTGVYENRHDWRPAVPEELTLPTVFRKNGYFVAGAGKIYHESYRRASEWDAYLQQEGKEPQPTGNTGVGGIKFAPLDCADEDLRDYRIVTWTIEQLQRAHDKPFFLACGLHKPHMPWNVPRKYYDLFPLDKIELPPYREDDLNDVPPAGVRMAKPEGDHAAILQSGRWKEAVQAYLATIAYTDMNIGRLLQALDQSAYRTNTIIVFWGDHGWHLGEKQHWRKFSLWEEAIRAPLIWVAPGLTQPGAVSTRPVDFMSIYPTLVDLCGIQKPSHLESDSLRPLFRNPSLPMTSPAITTYEWNNHSVRTESWHYIRYANGDEELYDSLKDPFEWTNLAAQAEFAPVKKQLAASLPQRNEPERPARANSRPRRPASRSP